MPKAKEVIYIKREDELEENDMRQCLANLLAIYRKNDALGVLTTVFKEWGRNRVIRI